MYRHNINFIIGNFCKISDKECNVSQMMEVMTLRVPGDLCWGAKF